MADCIIKCPLGFVEITGDLDGISAITILNAIKPSYEIALTDLQTITNEDKAIPYDL